VAGLRDRFRAGESLSRIEALDLRVEMLELRFNTLEARFWEKIELDELQAEGFQRLAREMAAQREILDEIIYWSGHEVTTKDLILQYQQSLNILEEQRAKFGFDLRIENQITDIKERLAELEKATAETGNE